MIFKTVSDDITGVTKSISIFNSTLSTMKKNIKNGQSVAYSIFNGNKINQKDIQSIINYADAIKNGAKPSEAYKNNLLGCSVAAKQYVVDARKAGKSTDELVDGLKDVPKTSKAATLGLKALSIAGNMIAMWAISEVITRTVSAINDYANSAEIAREKVQCQVIDVLLFNSVLLVYYIYLERM